ncbi:MAG TPA: SNF2-related protein [Candidatus Paceibacterota bacterium]|nr:SNF2-related protein [Candidatus Paceibacterota bacterium]
MQTPELTESFLTKTAGWEAVKQARAWLSLDRVLSSCWAPPVLRGVVQEGTTSYRAGLVIKSSFDVENLCTCRASTQWGTICAHSVAVGLHYLQTKAPAAAPPSDTPESSPPSQPNRPALAPAKPAAIFLRNRDNGEPAELSWILPPNLATAIEKNRVMICCEARWRNKQQPLNALPRQLIYRLGPEDDRALERWEELAGTAAPGMAMLSTALLLDLLPLLVNHPRVSLGRGTPLNVRSTPWRPQVLASLAPSGDIQLRLKMPSNLQPLVLTGKVNWVLTDDGLQPSGLPPDYTALLQGPLCVPRPRVPQLLGPDWPKLQAGCELQADFRLEDFSLTPMTPRFVLSLHGGLAQLQAVLQCRYGTRMVTPGVTADSDTVWLPDPDHPIRYSTRDLQAEQSALALLWRSGFRGPNPLGRLELKGQEGVFRFFAREYSRLCREWEVTLEERLERSARQNLEPVTPQLKVLSSGEQWFDLSVTFGTASGESLTSAEIQRLLLSGQGYHRLSNGRVALLDTGAVEELQEVLRDCNPQQNSQGYRIHQSHAGFLDATVNAQPSWSWKPPDSWRERLNAPEAGSTAACPPLGALDSVLRPYQKTGVSWLHFLRRHQFGGLLADEMGLGKTLQALAFLQTKEPFSTDPSSNALPSLVVCPTSLVYNWDAEARRFTPDLKVLVLHGPQRDTLWPRISESNLVITSYALMRRDADRYQSTQFDTVILDEAQHIKNRQSQNAQAVKSIRAHRRLVLTGTPLENSVLDLWSIFDFLMPGYLGSDRDFRERYELPITRDRDPQIQNRLARRIRPFVLRRLKQEVAPELPNKIEQINYCELTEAQASVYQQILQASRREVFETVSSQGLAKSRMVILTALLRLRQTCCDLRLLKLEQADSLAPSSASAKIDLFNELLDEAIDGNHRVLVFSQFVELLQLLKQSLDQQEIAFCYLDGSTRDRAAEVARFQQNPSIPVFLISLKAGGVGLNLTAADTVIHFDPWWNPAVEDQATDRAHRLGQSRVVTSYKLITRGTVEEKILNLQQRKRELTRQSLAGDESLSEILSFEDVQELLS